MLDLGGLCPPLPHCTHPLWGLQSLRRAPQQRAREGMGWREEQQHPYNSHVWCREGLAVWGMPLTPQSKSECTLVHAGVGVCRPWNCACVSTFVCVHVNAYEKYAYAYFCLCPHQCTRVCSLAYGCPPMYRCVSTPVQRHMYKFEL